ncbi:MAG TPA: AbrB/MazE/SpoVT family DNA-binding domain-containing protein [Candidatus Bathyarchaeia archaeon]|nr:AbrB/MazE/SpoVT family DNA-binding domain-containing protein [Candidatus Bathyarchaeia archaeon]
MSKKGYSVKRRLQEQSGSYFVVLPKLWVEKEGLQESDELSVIFNGIVKVIPIKKEVKPIE